MYLDEHGDVVSRASIDGPLPPAFPGAGRAGAYCATLRRLPLDVSLAPAIILARDGFPVDEVYRRMAGFFAAAQRQPAAASAVPGRGELPPLGHRLQQPDLARNWRGDRA